MNIVLDACAVIAFFRDEQGAEKVEKYLSDSQYNCLIHAINMCEVYYDFLRSEGEEVAEEIVQDLQSINVIIRDDLKVDFWQQVGKYKGTIKRISIADCFALTLANRESAILLTFDRKELEPIIPLNICQIDFIR